MILRDELSKPLFTVFTPTFNRAHTLHRVYESLRNQTYRDFEWVIVDDGSTDHTNDLVAQWKREANFPIRYFWQENKGKHVAFNRAVREANGKLFLPLDSDDACIPTALERFNYHWEAIPLERRDRFTGVCALCMDQNGRLVGDLFPFNSIDSDSMEIKYRYKVKGEKWGFNRIDVLRCFPYPEREDIKFILEGFAWYRIASYYKTRFINEILRIYYVLESQTSDQLSQRVSDIRVTVLPKYSTGNSLYYELLLNNNIRWLRYDPVEFTLYALNYIRFSLHSKKKPMSILKNVYTLGGRLLVLSVAPLAILLYLCESNNVFWIHRAIRRIRRIMEKTLSRK